MKFRIHTTTYKRNRLFQNDLQRGFCIFARIIYDKALVLLQYIIYMNIIR